MKLNKKAIAAFSAFLLISLANGTVTAKAEGKLPVTKSIGITAVPKEKTIIKGSTKKQVYSKHKKDVVNLRKIIKAQRKLGADVSTNLDSKEYTWSKHGRLTGIYWSGKGLKGTLSLEKKRSSLFYRLKNLDVSNNTKLEELYCPMP